MRTAIVAFLSMVSLGVLFAGSQALATQDTGSLSPDSGMNYDQYRDRQRTEFARFREMSLTKFVYWRGDDKKQFQAFKKEIIRQWGEYIGSTDRMWVEYDAGARSRSVVDFKDGIVTVSVRSQRDGVSLPDVKKRLQLAVERTIASRGMNPMSSAHHDAVLARPVLTNQVVDSQGTAVTPDNAQVFARRIVETNMPETAATGAGGKTYTLSFPLAPDHLARRMAPFVPVVKMYCDTYDLNLSQVLALIHTESYFNPMARSSANAIGLMQLVPDKGAREAYLFISNADPATVPSPETLFDPETNIRLGCAYLHLLKTRDFGTVTNNDCGMYCSIASYNGGPACVAYAFTGANKMPRAIRTINAMNDAGKVYVFLVQNLPRLETRRYLEDVVERTRLYE